MSTTVALRPPSPRASASLPSGTVPAWRPAELHDLAAHITALATSVLPLADLPRPSSTELAGVNAAALAAAHQAISTSTHTLADVLTDTSSALTSHATALDPMLQRARWTEQMITTIRLTRASTVEPTARAGLSFLESYYHTQLRLYLFFLDAADGAIAGALATAQAAIDALADASGAHSENRLHGPGLDGVDLPATAGAQPAAALPGSPWANGEPAELVDVTLRERLSAELADPATDSARREYLQKLAETLEANPDAYLLELSEAGAAVAVGNPDTATAVATMVPGVGSSNPGHNEGAVAWARDVQRAAGENSSVVAWSAYRAPADLGAAVSGRPADRAAGDLRGFQSQLRARTGGQGASLTVVGYSYGSVVVGHAAGDREEALEADHVVLIGSPGTGANHARDLAVNALDGHAEIYVGRNDGDPIGITTGPFGGAHGPDPASPLWGADGWLTPEGIGEVPSDSARQQADVRQWFADPSDFRARHRYRGYSDAIGAVMVG